MDYTVPDTGASPTKQPFRYLLSSGTWKLFPRGLLIERCCFPNTCPPAGASQDDDAIQPLPITALGIRMAKATNATCEIWKAVKFDDFEDGYRR